MIYTKFLFSFLDTPHELITDKLKETTFHMRQPVYLLEGNVVYHIG